MCKHVVSYKEELHWWFLPYGQVYEYCVVSYYRLHKTIKHRNRQRIIMVDLFCFLCATLLQSETDMAIYVSYVTSNNNR